MVFDIAYVLPVSWTVASSAYRSDLQWSKQRRRSSMKIRNNVVEHIIDPCGTPERTQQKSVSPYLLTITQKRVKPL